MWMEIPQSEPRPAPFNGDLFLLRHTDDNGANTYSVGYYDQDASVWICATDELELDPQPLHYMKLEGVFSDK